MSGAPSVALAGSVAAAGLLGMCGGCNAPSRSEAARRPVAAVHVNASPVQRPFAAESGRLHVEGRAFYDGGGQAWRWRGASQFLLFARFLNGEDISPQLDWLIDRGFNVVRVFGEVPPGFHADEYGITNYERPS